MVPVYKNGVKLKRKCFTLYNLDIKNLKSSRDCFDENI